MTALAAALLVISAAGGAYDDALGRAEALYNEAEWDAALKELGTASKLASTDAQRVAVWLREGIVLANVPNPEAARASWRRALELDSKATLPLPVSPRVKALFDEVQKAALAALPKDAPKRERLEPAGPAVPLEAPEAMDESHFPVVPLIALGASVAAGGVGLGFALDANAQLAAARSAMDPLVRQQLQARASTDSLVAYIAFGVAGAAALTALITFIVMD